MIHDTHCTDFGALSFANQHDDSASKYIQICDKDDVWALSTLYLNYPIDLESQNNILLKHCCTCNKISSFKWIVSTLINNNICFDAHFQNDYLFRFCCKLGNYEMAKWLYKYCMSSRKKIDVHASNDYAFRYACKNGNISIAKWLIKISRREKNEIDINLSNNFAFRYSIHSSKIDTAKWLYELSLQNGEKIDINDYNLFFTSCVWNKIDVAKWIYYHADNQISGPIDIRANDDILFKTVCQNNSIDVAKWLADICNTYIVNVNNDTIDWKILQWYEQCTNDEIIKTINIKNKSEMNMFDTDCIICKHNQFENKICLPCRHLYCQECFIEWYVKRNKNTKCAYCQQHFDYNACCV